MKTEALEKLEAHIASECTAIDRERRFDEMIDECYSFDKVGGPFEHMLPSRVLKEMDPTAYRCGVNDYEDSENWVEVGGEYYDQREAEKAKAEFLDELDDQISALESEIEEAEAEPLSNRDLVSLQGQLEETKAEREAVENHTF